MDANGEHEQLDHVIQRLGERFHHLSPEVVSSAVTDIAAQLAAATVRDFVPLLVEKEARERLESQGP